MRMTCPTVLRLHAPPQALVFCPGALPVGAACSTSALISPPTNRHSPVRYNQVRKTITAPILPYVLLYDPKLLTYNEKPRETTIVARTAKTAPGVIHFHSCSTSGA